MRALCWNGVNDLRVETVGDPTIVNPHDVILKVGLTTTCGSDLHVIDGLIPSMEEGDILGHEFMGEVVEVGPEVKNIRRGDRVVVPSFISCGSCWYCN
ncbi:alcohol dehydrogenase catalytic domain-containing protein, partial [Cronobacter sakazakii]